MKKQFKGFTLIELLVVIAIIGLLSTLAVVALNSARQKSRDAKRVSEIKQIQTSLELFFADQNGYPGETAASDLGTTNYAVLESVDGFDVSTDPDGTIYMGLVPAAPTPPSPVVPYEYSGFASQGGADCNTGTSCGYYTITFTLEGNTGSLQDSTAVENPENIVPNCTATPNGITCL